jgi:hypothetical protein
MTDFANSQGLLWVAGLITFVMGMAIVALCNVWSADRRVLVTLLGWLTVVKGAVTTLFRSGMILHDPGLPQVLVQSPLTYRDVYALVGPSTVPRPN